MTQVHFSAEAKEDVRDAKEWYADQRPGLDLEFRDELDATLDRIRSFPASYPTVYKDVRRANLRRFPYSVFYRLRKADAFVLAVVHQARDPRRWQRRASRDPR